MSCGNRPSSTNATADELDAQAYDLEARAAALHARAARLRASADVQPAPPTEWLPVAESPLGKRKTLALARAGQLASTKVGRKVLVRRESLAQFLEQHRPANDASARDLAVGADGEDLFA